MRFLSLMSPDFVSTAMMDVSKYGAAMVSDQLSVVGVSIQSVERNRCHGLGWHVNKLQTASSYLRWESDSQTIHLRGVVIPESDARDFCFFDLMI